MCVAPGKRQVTAAGKGRANGDTRPSMQDQRTYMPFRLEHYMAEVVGFREGEDVVAEGVGFPVRNLTDLRPTIQTRIIKEEPCLA